MKLGATLPSYEQLGAAKFDEFCEHTSAFLEAIDAGEALDAISFDDVATAESHPNGFYIIRLTDTARKQDGQVRIHLWHADEQLDRDEGEIHKHPWHLASKILHGVYLEQVATVTPVSDVAEANYMNIRMARDPNGGDINVHEDHRPVKVELSEQETYDVGESHFIPEPVFHHAPVPSDRLVVTLPIMGRVLTSERRFLAPINQTATPIEAPHPKASEQSVSMLWEQLEAARGR